MQASNSWISMLPAEKPADLICHEHMVHIHLYWIQIKYILIHMGKIWVLIQKYCDYQGKTVVLVINKPL